MDQEGVIKYDLTYVPGAAFPPDTLRELNAWRKIFHQTGLIGMDPARYGGVGFGNVSQRVPPFDSAPKRRAFVISGTQTGHLPDLSEQHYAIVTECDPECNRIVSSGPIRPSAEALTHGTIYGVNANARFVMHAHSPHIWRAAKILGLPRTHDKAAYGTPEMAAEVRRVLESVIRSDAGIVVMGGHEDGVVSFGETSEKAGLLMLKFLALAYREQSNSFL